LKATRSILPIVFTWVSDPVGSGFVTNLPHPGGNITGFHNFKSAIGGKWLAFLKQIAPDLRRVAVVHVPEIVPNVAFLHVVEAAAPSSRPAATSASSAATVTLCRLPAMFIPTVNSNVIQVVSLATLIGR
jgi:putative ABC transport system substrate-binding protein